MSDIFYDRRGHEKYADEIIPLHQKGYFAILVKDEKVLVTYPPQVSVPEFPGGTVSRREDFRGCLYRKLYEETGIEFELDWGEKSYQQIVNYFAEDARPFGEYCVYDQTFIVYDASSYGFDTSVSPWRTPENGNAAWLNIQDIFSAKTKINYTHWLAFQHLFNIKNKTKSRLTRDGFSLSVIPLAAIGIISARRIRTAPLYRHRPLVMMPRTRQFNIR